MTDHDPDLAVPVSDRDRETMPPPEPSDTVRPASDEPIDPLTMLLDVVRDIRRQVALSQEQQAKFQLGWAANETHKEETAKANFDLLAGQLDSLQTQLYGVYKALGVGHVRMDGFESTDKLHTGELLALRDELSAVSADAQSLRPPEMTDVPSVTVLLVDDNPHVLMTYTRAIARYGLSVLSASSAREALALLSNHVEVAVVDIQLGGTTDGIGLARSIRRERPGVGLVIVTGGVLTPAQSAEASALRAKVMQKPIMIGDLVKEILRVRGAGGG